MKDLDLQELITLMHALLREIDFMESKGDALPPMTNNYKRAKALLKKVNDVYSDRVTATEG